MPRATPLPDRRQNVRAGLRVLHTHRVGAAVTRKMSELVYIRGRPLALLEWIDLGGVRTPLYVCPLDPAKLRPDEDDRRVFHYDDLTTDPRFTPAD